MFLSLSKGRIQGRVLVVWEYLTPPKLQDPVLLLVTNALRLAEENVLRASQ